MRFINIDHAQEGMIVGRPLRGRKGEILLTAGTPLKSTFIETIKRLRYSGLYIEDEFSAGIEVEDIISDELRHKAVEAVRRMESDISAGASRSLGSQVELFAGVIDDIIESVLREDRKIVIIARFVAEIKAICKRLETDQIRRIFIGRRLLCCGDRAHPAFQGSYY